MTIRTEDASLRTCRTPDRSIAHLRRWWPTSFMDLKREAVAEAGPDRSPALAAAGRGSDDQVERFKLVQARAPMMTATGPAMA